METLIARVFDRDWYCDEASVRDWHLKYTSDWCVEAMKIREYPAYFVAVYDDAICWGTRYSEPSCHQMDKPVEIWGIKK